VTKEESAVNRGTFLDIDLNKLSENARKTVEVCSEHGIEVLGVTKGFSAIPEIVQAMADGGIQKFADARLENVMLLRTKGFFQHITLLRIPMISQADEVVFYTNCSLNSEYKVIQRLNESAEKVGRIHDIVLMIEVGDLREGLLPEEAKSVMRKIRDLRHIRVLGVGTNMGCYGGILPTEKNLNTLCQVAQELQTIAGSPFEVVSGGGTSSLMLAASGKLPKGINQLRVGEGILRGTATTHARDLPWLNQDAFVRHAEIIEGKNKPSVPFGEKGADAFGNVPSFEDNGIRRRAIVALGQQDVALNGITPYDSGIRILGASSDHMILDIEDAARTYKVGDQVDFRLHYQGLLTLCSSKYVRKVYQK
jgi:predicted amino acid racemase